MRLVVLGALLALAVPAGAQVVTAPPLLAGEILLEVEGDGLSRVQASTVGLTYSVSQNGTTAAEADAALQEKLRNLRQIARDAGVADSDLRVDEISSLVPGLGSVRTVPLNPSAGRSLGQNERAVAYSSVRIELRDPSRLVALRRNLRRLAISEVGQPEFATSDVDRARQAAKADALAKARADAQAYADRLGMRLLRIIRVSERDSDILDAINLIGPPRAPPRRDDDSTVETRIRVSVDFVLGPR